MICSKQSKQLTNFAYTPGKNEHVFYRTDPLAASEQMPTVKPDKGMKRGDVDVQYSENIICCKWYDNKAVMLLSTNLEGMDSCSNMMCRTKGSANKIPINCPNIVKLSNNGMDGVDIIDQKTAAYRLDRKSKFRFYLRIFFDLMDVALVNSYIAFQALGETNLNLLYFKIVVAKSLIGRYVSRKRAFQKYDQARKELSSPVQQKFLCVCQNSSQQGEMCLLQK